MIRSCCCNLTALTTMLAVVVVGLFAAPHAAHGQVACRYEVAATISAGSCSLGERPVAANAISPNGRYVCGRYCQCLCNPYESFVYDMQTGIMFTIPRPPGIFTSEANDVTDAGVVVGSMGGTPGDFGYVYDYPAHTYLETISPAVPDGSCAITGINASNTVCGTRSVGPPPAYLTSAFIKTANGPIVDLGLIDGWRTVGVAINDAGQVVVTKSTEIAAYLWDGVTLLPAPPLHRNGGFFARGIGRDGQIIGTSLMPKEYRIPIVSDDGLTSELPRLFGPSSTAATLSINSEAVISGLCSANAAPFDPRACLWWGSEVIVLQPRLVAGTGVILRDASAISDTGLIVCHTYGSPVVLRPLPGPVGDVNCDGVIDRWDLLEVIAEWGKTVSLADLNGDGTVGVADLLTVIVNWSIGGAP